VIVADLERDTRQVKRNAGINHKPGHRAPPGRRRRPGYRFRSDRVTPGGIGCARHLSVPDDERAVPATIERAAAVEKHVTILEPADPR
jgi:hypothetical protein